jgi:alkylation response protein AidB-like acyl-CoA dehydrogenase
MGKPIAQHQAVAFMIADMAANIEAVGGPFCHAVPRSAAVCTPPCPPPSNHTHMHFVFHFLGPCLPPHRSLYQCPASSAQARMLVYKSAWLHDNGQRVTHVASTCWPQLRKVPVAVKRMAVTRDGDASSRGDVCFVVRFMRACRAWPP